jgi:hypothetical protein
MRDDDDWGLSPLSGTIGSLCDMDTGRRRRKLPKQEPIGFVHFGKLKPKRKLRRSPDARKPKIKTNRKTR